VDHGEDQVVTFDDAIAAQTEAWLRTVLACVPSGVPVRASELAAPGAACEGCAFRHVCRAYHRAAPTWWLADVPFRPPLDVWGVVEKVAAAPEDRVDLTLRDAAGRMVRVFGLDSSRTAGAEAGQTLWFYSLRSGDRRGGPDMWRHPVNFHEVLGGDPHGRAWALEVFTDGPVVG
jgi:hypothetical protein